MDSSRLKRSVYPIPNDILKILAEEGLMDAYRLRPPYQQNDYIGWITRAKLPATREKRVRQMIEELRGGEKYMGMDWHKR